jgi:quercetin dioxygenase-like cupin family protein
VPLSRRHFGLLVPALARAAQQQGQIQPLGSPVPLLPQKVYHDKQIAYTGNDEKKGRRFFFGATHGAFNLEMHETILGPGKETHPPHKHEHEEIIVVTEGTLEVHMEDQSEIAETGSVIFFGSNRTHNAKNAGTVPCRYYVVELRGKEGLG